MGDIRELADSLLASVAAVDLNALAETVLFTVPPGKECIITKVIMRAPSAAVTTASISFGYDTGDADNVIDNGVRTLTNAARFEIIAVRSDAMRGVAAGTFKVDVNTAEGGALTATFEVFGYLY